MTLESKELHGIDHGDPNSYYLETFDDEMAIGLASVVTTEEKRHNWTNNEDSCGISRTQDFRIASVADAHWGARASQEAVKGFPEAVVQNISMQTQDIRQALLEVVLRYGDEVETILRSTVTKYLSPSLLSPEKKDASTTQFWSVINTQGKYFLVGLGDCGLQIISQDTQTQAASVKQVLTGNEWYGDFGRFSPRHKIECDFYKISSKLEKTPPVIDNPVVKGVVNIVELSVKPGDILLLHSDGFPVAREKEKLTALFRERTLRQGLEDIMGRALIRENRFCDNLSLAAMRVS